MADSSHPAATTAHFVPTAGLRCSVRAAMGGLVFAVSAMLLTVLSLLSEKISEVFIKDNMKFLEASVCMLALGGCCGIFHVWNDNKGYPGERERRINMCLGVAGFYLVYAGVVFWLVLILAHSSPLRTRVLWWVVLELGPVILAPFASYLYHGEWTWKMGGRLTEHDQEQVNVQEELELDQLEGQYDQAHLDQHKQGHLDHHQHMA